MLAAALLIGCAISFGASYVASQSRDDPPVLYQDVPLDPTLLRMDKLALEEAYRQQVMKLFAVWVASQAPADAMALVNGLRIARRAYTQAASQIAKREQLLLEETMRQQGQEPGPR